MNEDRVRSLVQKYIAAYNTFDIDAMLALIHPDIEFQNVSGGEVTATASGIDEFRSLAEQSKSHFSSRRQTITDFAIRDAKAVVEIDYEAILAVDLPNGLKAGETLRLTGRSEFSFRDGKINQIIDIV